MIWHMSHVLELCCSIFAHLLRWWIVIFLKTGIPCLNQFLWIDFELSIWKIESSIKILLCWWIVIFLEAGIYCLNQFLWIDIELSVWKIESSIKIFLWCWGLKSSNFFLTSNQQINHQIMARSTSNVAFSQAYQQKDLLWGIRECHLLISAKVLWQ